MIKELELVEMKKYADVGEHYGVTTLRIPNNKEIMDKINEIIRHINSQEE